MAFVAMGIQHTTLPSQADRDLDVQESRAKGLIGRTVSSVLVAIGLDWIGSVMNRP